MPGPRTRPRTTTWRSSPADWPWSWSTCWEPTARRDRGGCPPRRPSSGRGVAPPRPARTRPRSGEWPPTPESCPRVCCRPRSQRATPPPRRLTPSGVAQRGSVLGVQRGVRLTQRRHLLLAQPQPRPVRPQVLVQLPRLAYGVGPEVRGEAERGQGGAQLLRGGVPTPGGPHPERGARVHGGRELGVQPRVQPRAGEVLAGLAANVREQRGRSQSEPKAASAQHEEPGHQRGGRGFLGAPADPEGEPNGREADQSRRGRHEVHQNDGSKVRVVQNAVILGHHRDDPFDEVLPQHCRPLSGPRLASVLGGSPRHFEPRPLVLERLLEGVCPALREGLHLRPVEHEDEAADQRGEGEEEDEDLRGVHEAPARDAGVVPLVPLAGEDEPGLPSSPGPRAERPENSPASPAPARRRNAHFSLLRGVLPPSAPAPNPDRQGHRP
mmetsp:Transcript_1545/g.5758  ORF Transcript_1545/g.5758 Transcript_1545/m.5758 type:complete len:439 (-) Transcript_1545:520-1836(-)